MVSATFRHRTLLCRLSVPVRRVLSLPRGDAVREQN